MRKRRVLFSCCFCLLLAVRLAAQLPGIAFSHYTTDDGLPNDFIRTMALDPEGLLWIGTNDGLARFDGHRFEVFRHSDSLVNTLPGNIVVGISCDPTGRVWVSVEGGVAWYDPAGRCFRRLSLTLPGKTTPHTGFVSMVVSGHDGYAWIGTDYHLVKLNLQTLTTQAFPFPDGYAGGSIPYVDRRGRLWLTVDGHAFQVDPVSGKYQYYFGRRDTRPGFGYSVGPIQEDPSGNIWTCTWGKGLYRFNEQSQQFEDVPDGPAIANVFLFDHLPGLDSVIWLGGGVYGVYIYHPRDQVQYQFPRQPLEPYAHNGTRAGTMLHDPHTDIVWLGTEAGLEKYDPNDLKFARTWLPDAEKMTQFCSVSGIVQDPREPDRYWITVWGVGLYEWRRRTNTFRYFGERTGLYSNELFGIVPSRRGTYWLAGFGGIEEMDANGRSLRRFQGFFKIKGINHKVLSLMEGRDGRVWFGANFEGLFCLDPVSGQLDHIELPHISDRTNGQGIYGLIEDAQGQVYASSVDGVYRCRPGQKRATLIYRRPGQLMSFGDLAFDHEQGLWVACRDGALRFDTAGRLVDSLSTRRGMLRNNSVHFIETDQAGDLWIATVNGLHRFRPSTRAMTVFTKNDGLFSNSVENLVRVLPNGELFVGHLSSFNLIDPAHIPTNHYPPRVRLTEVRIANRIAYWSPGQRVQLYPGENVVTFDFSVVNYTQPDETMLAHRLVGFDAEWVETPLTTPITYTNLDGGEYVLEVRARNGDGVWSTDLFVLQLQVIPPFYQTAWFRFLLALLLVGVVAFVFWYREQERRRLDAIRRRIARDLHDDMGSTLSSIRFFSEVAQARLPDNDPTEARPLLGRIAGSAASLSDAIRDIVWAIGGKNDRLDDLVTRMREFGLKVCEAKNITFRTDLPEELPDRPLRPDQLRNFYLVFKEALNNAAKYADGTEITLRLRVRRRFLILEIADNGRGFDPATANGSGNGLSNLQHRALEIGGKLTLDAAPGRGTCVTLTAPLN